MEGLCLGTVLGQVCSLTKKPESSTVFARRILLSLDRCLTLTPGIWYSPDCTHNLYPNKKGLNIYFRGIY